MNGIGSFSWTNLFLCDADPRNEVGMIFRFFEFCHAVMTSLFYYNTLEFKKHFILKDDVEKIPKS